MTGIEGRNPNEPMNAYFCLEVAVRIGTGHRYNSPLDPRLFPGLQIKDLGLKAFPLAPAKVHPEKHLGPVLGLGPARPRIDREDGIAPVMHSREDKPEFQLPDTLLERSHRLLDFSQGLFVICLPGELQQRPLILDFGTERCVKLELFFQIPELLQSPLCSIRVLPEVGLLDYLL